MVVWNPQVALAVFIGLTASVEDLIRREIPNWIPATGVLGGLCAAAGIGGWQGAASSLLGSAIGFAVFLVFYALGGMGGGDVKLMAGFGAVLGSGRMLAASVMIALVGGVFAAAAMAWHKASKNKNGTAERAYIPYAPAIAVGGWLALWTF